MKLKPKMMLGIGIPLVLAFLIMGIAIYSMASSALRESTSASLEEMSQHYAHEIDSVVRANVAVVDSVGKIWEGALPVGADMQAEINSLAKSDGMLSFYFGRPDGTYAASNTMRDGWDPRTRDWYKSAVAADGKTVVSEAYMASSSGKPVITISRAVKKNGEILGVIGANISLDTVADLLKDVKVGETGTLYVLGSSSEYIYHHGHSVEEKMTEVDGGSSKELVKRMMSGKVETIEDQFRGVDRFFAVSPIRSTGWTMVVSIPQKEAFEDVAHMSYMLAGICVLTLLILLAITYCFLGSATTPIARLSALAERIAGGDLSMQIPASARTDEIGILHNNNAKMLAAMRDMVADTGKAAEQVSSSSEELTASANQTAQASQSAVEAVVSIAEQSAEQSKIVGSAEETVNDMNESMDRSRKAVAEAMEAAGNTQSATAEGRELIDQVVAGVERLARGAAGVDAAVQKLYDDAKNIARINEAITEISGQTKLLALNAAIEAARAGGQGRGFAVVADEVRKLAEQSEEAAQEINDVIKRNGIEIQQTFDLTRAQQEEVQESVAHVKVAGEEFGRIADDVTRLTEAIRTIREGNEAVQKACTKTVGQVERISKASQSVQKKATDVSAVSEQQAASTQEIAAASHTLADLAEKLQAGVKKFKLK